MQIISKRFIIERLFKKKADKERSLYTLDDPNTQARQIFKKTELKNMIPRLEVMFRKIQPTKLNREEQSETIGLSDHSIIISSSNPDVISVQDDSKSLAADEISIKSIVSSDSHYFTGRRVGIYHPSPLPNRDEPIEEDSDQALVARHNQAFKIIVDDEDICASMDEE